MKLFSHEDKQAIYKLSDMATGLRKIFLKYLVKLKYFGLFLQL